MEIVIRVDGIIALIKRKKVKYLRLTVKAPDGKVIVSAPYRASLEEIKAFVSKNIKWLNQKIEEVRKTPQNRPIEYRTGENISIFGENYVLIVQQGKNNITLKDGKLFLVAKGGSVTATRERLVKEWERKILSEKIATLLPKWEKITSLQPDSWQIKDMKTRWGTCNIVTKKIWFSLQLVHKNEECIEYVILHELTHLLVKGHGKDFKEIMTRFMPDWTTRKRILNSKL